MELSRRGWFPGSFYLPAVLAIPWIATVAVGSDATGAYGWLRELLPVPAAWGPAALALLYLYFPFFCIVIACRRSIAGFAAAWFPRGVAAMKAFAAARWGQAVAAVLLVAASAWLARQTLDADTRSRLLLNYYCRLGMWQDFLNEIRCGHDAECSVSRLCDINRALFETGKLPAAMFAFPQRPGALFARGADGAYASGSCEVLLQLGCVNEAEHVAAESLEICGPRPRILRQLATIYIAKGRPETARVFLGALRKDIVEGSWAEACLTRLERDPALSGDEEIDRLRSFMLREDALDTTRDDGTCCSTFWRRTRTTAWPLST